MNRTMPSFHAVHAETAETVPAPSMPREVVPRIELGDIAADVVSQLGERLFSALVSRAQDGGHDGALLARFNEAQMHAVNRGLTGQAVVSDALRTILTDAAVEVREALSNEALRIRASRLVG